MLRTRKTSARRTRPWHCPSAARSRSPHAPAPPSSSPAEAAAADPGSPLRAARCRRTPRQTDRSPAESRRTAPSSSPARTDRDRRAHQCPTVRAALPQPHRCPRRARARTSQRRRSRQDSGTQSQQSQSAPPLAPSQRGGLERLQRPTAPIPFPANALRSRSVLDGRTPASPTASCPRACPGRFASPAPSASQGQAPSTAGLPLQLPDPPETARALSRRAPLRVSLPDAARPVAPQARAPTHRHPPSLAAAAEPMLATTAAPPPRRPCAACSDQTAPAQAALRDAPEPPLTNPIPATNPMHPGRSSQGEPAGRCPAAMPSPPLSTRYPSTTPMPDSGRPDPRHGDAPPAHPGTRSPPYIHLDPQIPASQLPTRTTQRSPSPPTVSAHRGGMRHRPSAPIPAQTAPRSALTARHRPERPPHAPRLEAARPRVSSPATLAPHRRLTHPSPLPSPAHPAPRAPQPLRLSQASVDRGVPLTPDASSRVALAIAPHGAPALRGRL